MARKKKYKGIVLREFRHLGVLYIPKEKFETTDKSWYNYLINTKNLK